jgi:diguanylate cyclase (GGDEF)-like protein
MSSLLKFSLRHPRWLFSLLLLLTLLAALQLPQLRISITAQSMMEKDTPAWNLLQKTEQIFGRDDISILYLNDPGLFAPENLALIRTAVQQIDDLPFVDHTISLFSTPNVQNRDGTIITRPFFETIAKDPAAIARTRDEALSNPLLLDNLISRDGNAMAVNIYFKDHAGDAGFAARSVAAIDDLLTPLQGRLNQVYHIGSPDIHLQLNERIGHDQKTLMPLAMLVLLLTLALSLRRLSGALIPLFTATLSVIWTLGLMAAVGIPVNIMTSIIPALVIIIGSTEDIHLLTEYMTGLDRGMDQRSAIDFMADNMGLTVSLTFLTTYIGFLSTALNDIELLYQFGLIASTGLLFNFVVTVFSVPVLLRTFGSRANPEGPRRNSALLFYQRLSMQALTFVATNRGVVWYLVSLLGAISLLGALTLRINNNPMDFLEPDSPLLAQTEQVHRDLSGIHTFSIVLDSGIEDTFLQVRYLQELREIQDQLSGMAAFDRSFSFADFVALVNSVMDDDVDDPRQLPEMDEIVREYMLFIQHRDVRGYVSPDFGTARILVRHNIGSSEELNAALERLESFMAEKVDPAFKVYVTGESVLSNRAVTAMAQGQFKSLLLLGAAIWLIVSLLFLNVRAGLVALLPNAIPVLTLFGVMGYAGIALDAGTSMVAAIALGICIDDTIHLMSRFHGNLKLYHNTSQALSRTVADEAMPIVTTSLALAAGFGILATSSFGPVANFGLLSAMVILIAMLATFVILPLLLGSAELLTVWELLSLQVRNDLLRRSPLFQNMGNWQIKKVILAGGIRQVARGGVLVPRGHRGDEVIILLKGRAEHRRHHADGSITVLDTLGVGGTLAEHVLSVEPEDDLETIALEDLEVLVFSWHRIHRISKAFPFLALRLYRNLTAILGRSLEHSRQQSEHMLDDLTGIYSRDFLVGRLEQEVRRSARYHTPLSFIALQIHVNQHGRTHPLNEVSDHKVRRIIEELESLVREVDIVARWNQGNPAILLPNTPIEMARETADRICRHLQTRFTLEDYRLEVQARCTRLDGLEGESGLTSVASM